MKKGCIIALVVFAAIIAVGIAVFAKIVYPKTLAFGTSGIITLVETAAASHAEEFGKAPKGTHEEVLIVLRGNNPKEINFFGSDIDGMVVDGKIVDLWRNPLNLNRAADGTITFTSAGPNGTHGDDDDVTSENIQNLVKKFEEKAAEAEAKSNQ